MILYLSILLNTACFELSQKHIKLKNDFTTQKVFSPNMGGLFLKVRFTHIHSFKNIPYSGRTPSTLLKFAFFTKKLTYLSKNSTFFQSSSIRAVLKIS